MLPWRCVRALLAIVVLCGCSSQPDDIPGPALGNTALGKPALGKPVLDWVRPQKRLLLMPINIVLSLRTADGTSVVAADRSAIATAHFTDLIRAQILRQNIALVALPTPTDPTIRQILHLHAALTAGPDKIGNRAALKRLSPLRDTLGPGVRALADSYGADYAVFFYLHDRTTSGGRVMVNIAANILLAVLSTGRVQQPYSEADRTGCLSLMNLYSGDIVWNHCLSDTSGDLTDRDDADIFLQTLFRGMPV